MRTIVSLATTLLLAATSHAATIHVPGDQPTIQAGIDAAYVGDTVLVAPGTYDGEGGGISFRGKDIVVASSGGYVVTTIVPLMLDSGFVLENGETNAAVLDGFKVHGGSHGLVIRNGAAGTIRNCLFSTAGDRGVNIFNPGPGVTITNCGISNHQRGGVNVYNGRGFDMIGCTITGNVGANQGGGLLIHLEDGVANVIDTIIEHNQVTTMQIGGGGLGFNGDGSLNVEGCTFIGNSSTGGGGGIRAIVSGGATLNVADCVFTDNSAGSGGGAMLWTTPQSPPMSVTDCTFRGNTATGYGGGGLRILPEGTSATIERCVFLENSAPAGSAVHARNGYPYFIGCTFALNDSPQGATIDTGGHGLSLANTIIAYSTGQVTNCLGPVDATCSDIFGNAGGDWIDCLDGQLGVNGNISQNPLFCDAGSGDLTIHIGSPCTPANSAGCGLIGARPVGCSTTAIGSTPGTLPTSWGAIKGRYH